MLLQQPDLVLLDECDAALDAASAAAVRRLLAEELPHAAILQVHPRLPAWISLTPAEGCCAGMQVAHRLDHVMACHTAVVMHRGCIVQCGPPQELAARTDGLLQQMLQASKRTAETQ